MKRRIGSGSRKERKKKEKKREEEDEEDVGGFVLDRGGDVGREAVREEEEDDEEEEEEEGDEEAVLRALVFGSSNPFEAEEEASEEEEGQGSKPPAAAWVDDDDETMEVDLSRRRRTRKLRKDAAEVTKVGGKELERRLRESFGKRRSLFHSWAEKDKDDGDDDDEDEDEGEGDSSDDGAESLLRSTMPLVDKGSKGRAGRLSRGTLDIVRCKDANHREVSNAVVQTLHFHPSGELLLTGGLDKTLRFFQIDGVNNPKVHGIFFQDMPIHRASFVGEDEVIIAGRKPFFYSYDVHSGMVEKIPRIFSSFTAVGSKRGGNLSKFCSSPCGKWLAFPGPEGVVMLVSQRTKQWVADFRLNGPADAVTFTPDSHYLIASGEDGDVYTFDLRSRRCYQRFHNQGGTATRSLAVSPNFAANGLLAVGSASGVVNMYDAAAAAASGGGGGDDVQNFGKYSRKPVFQKSLMNLLTPVTSLKFNPDGQVLAIASCEKRDALRLVHAESGTVFSNWPTSRTPIRYPYSLDFSPVGGYLAIGNDRGRVLLYQIRGGF